MNKTLLGFFSLASVLFTQTTLADNDNGFFLGIDLDKSIQAESTVIYDDERENKKISFDSSSNSLSAGYRTASNNRIKASYVKISVNNSNANAKFSGLDLDWQFVYGRSLIQPFWGFGFGSYTQDDSAPYNDGKDFEAFSFQLMTGAKFNLKDRLELSAAYHIRTMIWETVEYYDGNDYVSYAIVDSISSIRVGATFKF